MGLDPASKARLRTVYPDLAVRVIRATNDFHMLHGRKLRVLEGMRTLAYQAKLYAQGRTSPGRVVTHAKPGDSMHHYGCAVDVCFHGPDPFLERMHMGLDDKLWAEWGRLAQCHGLVWGGSWDRVIDKPHVQLTYGYTLKDIQGFHKNGGLEEVWRAFDAKRGVPPGQDWYGPLTKTKMIEIGSL